jgi:hypothetical protein
MEGVHAPHITITGSPTDAEVVAVLAALGRAPDAGETTGRAVRYRAEESRRRWRTGRSTPTAYRRPRSWGRPG